MIDVKAEREAYYDNSIDGIIWKGRKQNLALAMTKAAIVSKF